MAIYTSRYGNEALKDERYFKVGISLGEPKFPLGYRVSERCFMFMPTGAMLHMSDADYVKAFRARLDGYGISKVRWMLNKLQESAKGKDVVLLCYEDIRDPDQWCHRTLLAEWVRENIGMEIEELDDPGEVRYKNRETAARMRQKKIEEQYEQLSLFG